MAKKEKLKNAIELAQEMKQDVGDLTDSALAFFENCKVPDILMLSVSVSLALNYGYRLEIDPVQMIKLLSAAGSRYMALYEKKEGKDE